LEQAKRALGQRPEQRLRAIADDQAGLFTRRQAQECGFSRYQVRRRLAVGVWRPVLGPVFALAGLQITAATLDRAAHLALPGAVLGGPSAARWWGVEVPDCGPTVFLDQRRQPRLLGVRLLRDPLAARDVEMVDGVLVTTRARAVFDCLRLLTEKDAVNLLDRALQQGWITVAELADRVLAHSGRLGAPRLARLTRLAGSGARSAAERIGVRLLRDAGITGWTANAPVHDDDGLIGLVDIAFEAVKLALEFDGWAYHVTPDRFTSDRRRQNRLVAAGWTVLRFTWRDLTERPEYVIATITAMLARLGRRPR